VLIEIGTLLLAGGHTHYRYTPEAARTPEALLYLSFLPIAGGGAMLVVGLGRRINPDLDVRR
jgi:hypothetical protein